MLLPDSNIPITEVITLTGCMQCIFFYEYIFIFISSFIWFSIE